MTCVLYDRTGAGVFNLANRPVGTLQGACLLNRQGRVVAWFDGSFVWDEEVWLFVEGAAPQGDLMVPKTLPLRVRLGPTRAPLLVRVAPPPRRVWSETSWTNLFEAGARA